LRQKLKSYIAESFKTFDKIPAERKVDLKKLAEYVEGRIKDGQQAKLTFICTHNSRRSHMAQIWGQAVAAHYGIPNVETFSGGTEATAFNPRAVAAMQRAGFEIEKTTSGDNPIYLVRYDDDKEPMQTFSKVYDHDPNPTDDFCAVMTCSDADKNCPVVLGASLRVSIPYEDPKAADGTDQETAVYDERCRQISSELLYIFSQVKVD